MVLVKAEVSGSPRRKVAPPDDVTSTPTTALSTTDPSPPSSWFEGSPAFVSTQAAVPAKISANSGACPVPVVDRLPVAQTLTVALTGDEETPPPPPALPTPKAKSSKLDPTPRLSIGSIGHPHSCSPACRFVKRQAGCRDGVMCKMCHQCFWQRRAEQTDIKKAPTAESSLPAAPPLGITADVAENGEVVGEVSTNTVDDDLASSTDKQNDADRMDPRAFGVTVEVDGIPISVGSRGHPHSCGQACKYLRRAGGCRDGTNCEKCHLCQWRRGLPPKNGFVGNKSEGSNPGFTKQSMDTLRKLIQLQLFYRQRSTAEAYRITGSVAVESGRKASDTKSGLDVCNTPSEIDGHSTTANSSHDAESENCAKDEDCMSLGSINHPHECGKPCKYFRKAMGCKDGRLCIRCHLCRWQRRGNAVRADLDGELDAKIIGHLTADVHNTSATALEKPAEASVGSVGHPLHCQPACKYNGRRCGCRDGPACPKCHLCRWSKKQETKPVHTDQMHLDGGFAAASGQGPPHPVPVERHAVCEEFTDSAEGSRLEKRTIDRGFCSAAFAAGISEAAWARSHLATSEDGESSLQTPRQRGFSLLVESCIPLGSREEHASDYGFSW